MEAVAIILLKAFRNDIN